MNKFKTKEYRELKSKNYRLFSFSELSVIQECNLQYYYQYIQRIKGRNNVYSFLGDIVHNSIEDFYSKNIDKEEMLDSFRINFNNCQYSFDNENIKKCSISSKFNLITRNFSVIKNHQTIYATVFLFDFIFFQKLLGYFSRSVDFAQLIKLFFEAQVCKNELFKNLPSKRR